MSRFPGDVSFILWVAFLAGLIVAAIQGLRWLGVPVGEFF